MYRLSGLIEVDDAFVGGKQKGKRGRGASGKTPILVAVESKDKQAGYIAIKAVSSINHKTVSSFVEQHILPSQEVHSDACPALNIIDKT